MKAESRFYPIRILPSKARSRGMTLIEVLVAVVVLSIGLLGLAGLQANGTKFNHSASLRSQASHLAYDMTDRMRANRGAVQGGAYDTPLATLYSAPGPVCGAAMAAYSVANDVNQWKSCLETRLPVGRGRIARVASGTVYVNGCGANLAASSSDVVVVEVMWDNSRLQNEAALECFVVRTEI